MKFTLSRHAQRRMRQRGIKQEQISAVLRYFDLDQSVGKNCRVLRTSTEAAKLAAESLGNPSIIRKLSKIVVIENELNGRIVTILHDYGRRTDRRLRRTFH